MTWRHTVAALVGVLLLAACAQAAPTPSASPTGTALGPIGGTLRVGMDLAGYESYQVDEQGTYNRAWDPQTTWAQEPFELFRCCLLRTLMSFNGRSTREGGAELRPDLAADIPTISADGLTWTFRLKPGLHYAPPFADTQIVAGDLVRALERTLRPDPLPGSQSNTAYGPYSTYFAQFIAGAQEYSDGKVGSISGLETPDDLTFVVHLVQPAGDLGLRLALPAAAPLPAGAADGHDAGYGRYLVASGPYMIEGSEQLEPSLPPDQQPTVPGYVPGSSLTLVHNPSWQRAGDSLRSAIVDRIEISQVSDYESALRAIQDDTLDLRFDMSLEGADIQRLRTDSSLAPRVHVTPALASDWITMNLAQPPFDDIHVRRAVMLATNKKDLVGIMSPGDQIQHHAIPDAFENGLLTDYDPFATPADGGNLEQAQAQMALSSYDSNADGVCDDPACATIRIPIADDRDELVPGSQAFAAQLAPLGLVLQFDRVSPADAFKTVTDPATHTPLVFTVGWGSDYFNASNWFGPLASGALIAQEDGFNLSLIGASPEQLRSWGYTVTEVPSVDAKIADCVALTGAAQFSCWAELDQYVMERVVSWIPLDNRQASRLTSQSVTNFEFDASLTMPALDQISVRLP